MRLATWSALVVVAAASVCLADVKGPREESLGRNWQPAELADWVLTDKAVITPETLGIAGQACLRSAQERLDLNAAESATRLTTHLQSYSDRDVYGRFAGGIRAISRLLATVQAIRSTTPQGYESACRSQVMMVMRSDRDSFFPLFEGRMNPKVPAELQKKGVHIVPLTWDGLNDQLCKLEGYYGSSKDARMWKLYTTSRLLANILPAETRSEELAKTFEGSPEVMREIAALNTYASVAGRANGASLGMSEADRLAAPMRMTGIAIGSRAASVLAYYTTGWRERLQAHVFEQNYPFEPFNLVSLSQVLRATAHVEGGMLQKGLSSSELGIQAVSSSLAGIARDNVVSYGPATVEFRKAAGLAWLALNAETNIRQNEKIAGIERVVLVFPTNRIVGQETAFTQVAASASAARSAYLAVDPQGRNILPCVAATEKLARAAASAVHGREGKITTVDPHFTGYLEDLVVPPVIADVGTEVNDEVDGLFRLHLATGFGRAVSTQIDGQEVSLWTPSAFVLHLSNTTSTAAWQTGLVQEHDKP